jgi:hypothetical protein
MTPFVSEVAVTVDLEARIRRLEDRALIAERVIKYAVGVDRRDWKMFADCFTDPVYADYSELGSPAGTFPRSDFVSGVSRVLDGFTATQHLSPNHVIEFDADDPDRAVCHSYMYAQHLLKGSEGGDFYLLRGAYTNHMLRISDGWRIERIIQRVAWSDGNDDAVAEAANRAGRQG